NCARVINPSQIDSDHDGIGDCCDGTCILDPLSTGCDECALPAGPGPSSDALTSASFRLKAGSAGNEDKAGFKLAFALPPGADIVTGPATATLTIGDDVFESALDCTATASRTSCDLP